MFLDASVVVAILTREPEFETLLAAISEAGTPISVSPLVRFEAAMAVARIKAGSVSRPAAEKAAFIRAARDIVDEFLSEVGAVELPIDFAISHAALDAAMTYGKTVGHKAALNMGDCFSYACAKSRNMPLLYKGNDFSETDLA